MSTILEFIQTEEFILMIFIINIILIVLVGVLIYVVINHRRKYINFMTRLGNGNNIDLILRDYIKEVKDIKKENNEIKAYCTQIDKQLNFCIQKIGIIRYNAFDNVGGNLSFVLALLDNKNDGILLNGIYGSKTSNIYSKPIKNGQSIYKLSEEEEEALKQAISNK